MGSRIGEFRRKVALGQYELTGHAKDGRRIRLICRLTELGRLRIITVFEE
ncbi:MAG: hypothetical protein KAY37_07460 [Phycisphaerae bacterium]|nr:hypothetical protein [Phycisphaerae bacterium]